MMNHVKAIYCSSAKYFKQWTTSITILLTATGLNLAYATEVLTTDTHKFTELRNNIWLAQTTAPVFNSNALVIVNNEDVILVDSHVTPAKARDLIRAIQEITDKPISALINSHHHWDHAHGNQEFAGLPIIGHEYAYNKLANSPLEDPTYKGGQAGNQNALKQIREKLEQEQDPKKRAEIEQYLALFSAHVKDFDEIRPQPPNITISERMTLYRGERIIQILFLGRAHTGGDLMVYFPQDKLVFTGDVAFSGPSFLGDGYVDEFPQTLENLKALDFDVFVPGHGGPITDLTRLDIVQEFYRDLWAKSVALHAKGKDAATAAKEIDLTNHTNIPITKPGVDLGTMQRIYHRLEHELGVNRP